MKYRLIQKTSDTAKHVSKEMPNQGRGRLNHPPFKCPILTSHSKLNALISFCCCFLKLTK